MYKYFNSFNILIFIKVPKLQDLECKQYTPCCQKHVQLRGSAHCIINRGNVWKDCQKETRKRKTKPEVRAHLQNIMSGFPPHAKPQFIFKWLIGQKNNLLGLHYMLSYRLDFVSYSTLARFREDTMPKQKTSHYILIHPPSTPGFLNLISSRYVGFRNWKPKHLLQPKMI